MAWNKIGEEFADFVLDVDTVLVEGNKYNACGVLFRYKGQDNYYSLSVNGNGSYTFGKRIEGEWTTVISWTSSGAIRSLGEVNHIRLIGHEDTFILYVNDVYVDQFVDDTLLLGDVAPAVTAYDTPPARATFDNIKISDVQVR